MRRIDVDLKRCANEECRSLMPRKSYGGRLEKPKQYAARQYCGKRCEPRLRPRRISARFCWQCRSRLIRRRRPGGRLEQLWQFRRRKWCDRSCFDLWLDEHRQAHAMMIRRGIVRHHPKKTPRPSRVLVCFHGIPKAQACIYCERVFRGQEVDPRVRWKTPEQWERFRRTSNAA